MSITKSIDHLFIPGFLKRTLKKVWIYVSITPILKYYHGKKLSFEQKQVFSFIKKNGLHQYPYEFDLDRREDEIIVIMDIQKNLPYVIIEGKRLYFKRNFTENQIKSLCACLYSAEQHIDSPHRYLSQSFGVEVNDIVMDIGSAEGIFALMVVEKASKVYLMELDSEWIEALEATFSPWKGKVVIVNKFVSNIEDNKSVTIDGFLKAEKIKVDFIKIDTEGTEKLILEGASKTLDSSNSLRLAVASYHKPNDEVILSEVIKKYGFTIGFSKGYMIPLDPPWRGSPYLRRGVIRAIKVK